MYKVVLLRHGQSLWNLENRFTGWVDIDLTNRGRAEAASAADLLMQEGFHFDIAFTSVLKRAIRTLWLVMDGMDQMWLPVIRDWRLNERHYGALQGLNKAEMTEKHGAEQVHIWRRSYATQPPALKVDDDMYPGKDSRYASLSEDELPKTECLADVVARAVPYWREVICPQITAGKSVIVAAHGNSLRAMVKYLDNISDEDIPSLNIPTGVPLIYELDESLAPIKHYYLGDQDAIQAAIESVANQAKSK